MNQLNYSNINCNARRNVFVHSLAQMGASPKTGGRAPLASPWSRHWMIVQLCHMLGIRVSPHNFIMTRVLRLSSSCCRVFILPVVRARASKLPRSVSVAAENSNSLQKHPPRKLDEIRATSRLRWHEVTFPLCRQINSPLEPCSSAFFVYRSDI